MFSIGFIEDGWPRPVLTSTGGATRSTRQEMLKGCAKFREWSTTLKSLAPSPITAWMPEAGIWFSSAPTLFEKLTAIWITWLLVLTSSRKKPGHPRRSRAPSTEAKSAGTSAWKIPEQPRKFFSITEYQK